MTIKHVLFTGMVMATLCGAARATEREWAVRIYNNSTEAELLFSEDRRSYLATGGSLTR